jgi:hypothetical protein
MPQAPLAETALQATYTILELMKEWNPADMSPEHHARTAMLLAVVELQYVAERRATKNDQEALRRLAKANVDAILGKEMPNARKG